MMPCLSRGIKILFIVLVTSCSNSSTKSMIVSSINLETDKIVLEANMNHSGDDNQKSASYIGSEESSSQPCVVPLTTNPIPIERQRPLLLTYMTEEPERYVQIWFSSDIRNRDDRVDYHYNFEVDCDMDGRYESTYRYEDDEIHSYPIYCYYKDVGLHQIAMRGDIPTLVLDPDSEYDEDHLYCYHLVSLDQWGDIRWKTMHALMASTGKSYKNKPTFPQLKAKDTPDLRDVCDMWGMFRGNETFNTPIDNWDVSHVEDMSMMFYNCKEFNQNLNNWDVSRVRDMSDMFHGAESFNQDISTWNVSHVVSMSEMFKYAKSFNQNIGNWNVSHVDDMEKMFFGASSFNQDIARCDVSQVTNMQAMFFDSTSFNQDISTWDISSLETVYRMFLTKEGDSVCPKCEKFRQKVLQKNTPQIEKSLDFGLDPDYDYAFWGND